MVHQTPSQSASSVDVGRPMPSPNMGSTKASHHDLNAISCSLENWLDTELEQYGNGRSFRKWSRLRSCSRDRRFGILRCKDCEMDPVIVCCCLE